MKYRLTLFFLVFLGIAKSIGDITGFKSLSGIAAATNASPTMKVFTSHQGYETFSTKFYLEIMSTNASRHSVELTPELYRNLRGPYNRRNVYGAALSYGPVLSLNEHTSKMFESVSEFALCREEGLLSELNLDRDSIEGIALRYLPRQRNINPRYSQLLEVDCES